jgi:hypothetical protein
MAERLFDPDYRLGSSLFEQAQALSIAKVITLKTGADEQIVYQDIYNDTVARLVAHKSIARAIAVELMRKHIIWSRRLAAHLAPIASIKGKPR